MGFVVVFRSIMMMNVSAVNERDCVIDEDDGRVFVRCIKSDRGHFNEPNIIGTRRSSQ